MKLSSCNIKKILIFLEIKYCTFRPQPSKSFPKKISDFLPKKSGLKKFLMFS